ncbi:MAG: TRAP transporter substrate-binding protein DctP [Desulfotignum sp.]|nr:TRAP transporter substrate-binding protein DctP [Desulfotignum sp.]
MKKTSMKVWFALVCAAILMPGSLAMAQVELPMSTVYMNTHPTVVNAWQPWFSQVSEKTRGELKLIYYNPNTLASLPDVYDSTVSGMIGLGGMDFSRNPGKFPLYTVMELPGMAPSAECGSLVVWDLYQKYPEMQKELSEIKVLWQWVSATFQIHTTKKLVKNLADLKGLKIIAWNKTSVSILNALDANAIMIPPTDSYLALERGMADGILCPLAPIVSFKISEAVNYTTVCDLFVTPFWAGIGRQVWKSLPESAQQILTETTGESMASRSGLTLDEGALKDSRLLKEKGHAFYTLEAEEKAKWLDATTSLREEWVREMESLGHKNARAIMEDAYRLGKEYAKTTGACFK